LEEVKHLMTRVYETIPETIGKTPSFLLNHVTDGKGCEAIQKLEFQNPGGSVKERIYLSMITEAEKHGLISKKTTIIIPTGGKTGIGSAKGAAARGYHLVLTMPETMRLERRNLLRPYRAELVLVPSEKGMKGDVEKVEELVSTNQIAKDYLRNKLE
jgi:cysteine synthase A